MVKDTVLASLAGGHQRREGAEVRILRALLAEFGKFNALLMMPHHMADIALVTDHITAEDRHRQTMAGPYGNYAERCKDKDHPRRPALRKAYGARSRGLTKWPAQPCKQRIDQGR